MESWMAFSSALRAGATSNPPRTSETITRLTREKDFDCNTALTSIDGLIVLISPATWEHPARRVRQGGKSCPAGRGVVKPELIQPARLAQYAQRDTPVERLVGRRSEEHTSELQSQ